VSCLAPRGPAESVGPRRLSGVVVRPLNFTVRGQQRSYALFYSPVRRGRRDL